MYMYVSLSPVLLCQSSPCSQELVALQRRAELQARESNHVKRLAGRVLEQRAQVEQFFLEALAHVRKEVAANRYCVQMQNDISNYMHCTMSSFWTLW